MTQRFTFQALIPVKNLTHISLHLLAQIRILFTVMRICLLEKKGRGAQECGDFHRVSEFSDFYEGCVTNF